MTYLPHLKTTEIRLTPISIVNKNFPINVDIDVYGCYESSETTTINLSSTPIISTSVSSRETVEKTTSYICNF